MLYTINFSLLSDLLSDMTNKINPPKRYRDRMHAPSVKAYNTMVKYDRKMRKRNNHNSFQHLNLVLIRMVYR